MKSILLLIGIMSTLISCNNCHDDCVPMLNTFQFNYLSESGEDLLGGTTKKYEPGDIKVYSITADNKTIYAGIHVYSATPTTLAVAEVQLNAHEERAFLEMKGTVTDTVNLSYRKLQSKCCGTGMSIEEIKLNGIEQLYSPDIPVLIAERN